MDCGEREVTALLIAAFRSYPADVWPSLKENAPHEVQESLETDRISLIHLYGQARAAWHGRPLSARGDDEEERWRSARCEHGSSG